VLEVGLGYLTLNRSAKSLSGGEAQRIRLATQIGSKLVGVLYILDEPSIGLHQRDNHRLIQALKILRDAGNSILVVEHDKDIMLESDFILDMGPGAGIHGGTVVASGSPDELIALNSITAQYLSGKLSLQVPSVRRPGNGKEIEIKGASGHNLKSVNTHIPLGCFVCVTGVSGSGKSSLINETLYPVLANALNRAELTHLPFLSIKGISNLDKVIRVDQSPIGRTPRSNPATYTGVFNDIRQLFTLLPESKIRGYAPGRFSFNVKGGRCETCRGGGVEVIEMNFLPDVEVMCPTCHGKRYNSETLEVRYKGASISDVLDMTLEKAVVFFEHIPAIFKKISVLNEIGLGYLTLGQRSTTLSGGEAQRVKLATELQRPGTGNTLYILDEPTTGLHFEDVRLLLNVLDKLVEKGNSVLVIEHNMDVIKSADYLIDLGPEGGNQGGQVLFQGLPEEMLSLHENHTARFLAKEL
jgi:excinuclease ABC subunit A